MNILNRGFIAIKPTQEFLNWKSANSKDEIIEPENPESTIYLIEDEFWDEDELLKKYFKKIIKQELLGVSETKESWPQVETIEEFSNYFHTELGTFVFDLLKNPLNSEKIDL
jgi:hypothetical protein